MNIQNMDETKRENLIHFIRVTQEMLAKDGIANLSIRKIASEAGFHNSTIYLYFKDLDQLLMMASVSYFREYSHRLNSLSLENLSNTEQFIIIWDSFLTSVLKNPKIFQNFFYGKHSDNVTEILNVYYELFPEEKEEFSETIKTMYYGNNIWERCMHSAKMITDSDPSMSQDKINMLNDLVVSYLRYKLNEVCMDETLDTNKTKEEILSAVRYIYHI